MVLPVKSVLLRLAQSVMRILFSSLVVVCFARILIHDALFAVVLILAQSVRIIWSRGKATVSLVRKLTALDVHHAMHLNASIVLRIPAVLKVLISSLIIRRDHAVPSTS